MLFKGQVFLWDFKICMFLSSIIHRSGWICVYLLHVLGQSWKKKSFTLSYLLWQHCNIESIQIFFPVSVTVSLWFLLGHLKWGWEGWAEADPCPTPSSLLGLSLLRSGSALRSLVSLQLFSWWEWLLNDIQNCCRPWEVWLKLFRSLSWWECCGRIKMCLCDKELWEWDLLLSSTNHDTGSIFIKRYEKVILAAWNTTKL